MTQSAPKKYPPSKYCSRCLTLGVDQPKRSSFAFEGEKPKFCYDHKLSLMVNTNNKMCNKCNKITPIYNVPGKKVGIRCFNCKEPGMENVTNKCLCGCGKIPSYGMPNDTTPTYCSQNRLKGMVDIRQH